MILMQSMHMANKFTNLVGEVYGVFVSRVEYRFSNVRSLVMGIIILQTKDLAMFNFASHLTDPYTVFCYI